MAKAASTQISTKLLPKVPTDVRFGTNRFIQEAGYVHLEAAVAPRHNGSLQVILQDAEVPRNCRVLVRNVIKRGGSSAFTGTLALSIASSDGFITHASLPNAATIAAGNSGLSAMTAGVGLLPDGGGPFCIITDVTSTTEFRVSNTVGIQVGDLIYLVGSGVTQNRTVAAISGDLITASGTHGMTIGSAPGTYSLFIFKRTTVASSASSATQALTSVQGVEPGDVLLNTAVAIDERYRRVATIDRVNRVVTLESTATWNANDPIQLRKPYALGGPPNKGLAAVLTGTFLTDSGTNPLLLEVDALYVPNELYEKSIRDEVLASLASDNTLR